nr:hypothetical protein [uncultured Helicobacter sp.]
MFNVFYMKLDMSFGMDFEIDLRHEAGDFEHFSYYVRVYFDSDFLSTGEVETRE